VRSAAEADHVLMHTDLHIHLGRERARVMGSAPVSTARPAYRGRPISSPEAPVALRPVREDDHAAVARLAALDSRPAPIGDVLLALVDSRPVAALSLDDGSVVADPFAPSAGAVELLQVRAERLRAPRTLKPRRRRWVPGRRAAA
jgi:hypothetical protein